jgi:hypothetical protein
MNRQLRNPPGNNNQEQNEAVGALAAEFGISAQRISQIIHGHRN